MIRSFSSRPLIVCLPLLLMLPASMVFGGSLSPQEACGKRIYFQGTDCAGQEIKAWLGDTQVSAKIETCSSCHGAEGKGRPESGLDPGDITWDNLSLPYGHSHGTGRKHPAFTEQSFFRAVTQGIDPANNKLSTLMPRFRMSARQLSDLFAYIKRISSDFDPGIAPFSIEVGSLLPSKGSNAGAGDAVRTVLASYFDEVNERGGIYGRKIVVRFGEATTDPAEVLASARRLMDAPIFAMIAPFAPGAEQELASLAHENQLPVVGPLTLVVPDGSANPEVFYLSPGLQQLEAELIDWAADQRHIDVSHAAIVFAGSKLRAEVSPILDTAGKSLRTLKPQEFDYSPGNGVSLIEHLQHEGFQSVFFVGSGADALAWMAASGQAHWTPQMFLLGPLLGGEVLETPAEFHGRIYAIYPALADSADATPDFDAFAQRHQFPAEHRLLQISAYSAARILEDALTRAGRELSRENLIHSLEQIHEFRTGVLPEITFGPNRRVGYTRSNILCVDLESKRFQPTCTDQQQ